MSKFPPPFTSEVDFHKYLAGRYQNKYRNAKERGISFELTLQDLVKIYKRRTCYLTGKKLVFDTNLELDSCYATLDRIDNTKGYTPENTRLAASVANKCKAVFETGKGLIDLKDLVKMGNTISKHLK